MLRAKLILLLTVALVISFTLTIAATSPKDYTISYTFKNPDGTVFRIIKYYLRDSNKFRSEYISTVLYKINSTAEANTGLSNSANSVGQMNSEANMQAEHSSNPEPYTIEILRKDKKLVWSMDPPSKTYIEVPLEQESWENVCTKVVMNALPGFKKTGQTKILSYDCDIYEMVQTIKEETWSNKVFIARDLNVVLKTELKQNGKLVEIMEANQFNMKKPEASLFNVPAGYQKNDNNQ